VIAMFSKGFKPDMEEGKLSAETRKLLADKVLERIDSTENYEGKKHRFSTIIQRQARNIASFVRGEAKYRPFVGGW
ncbi:MAG: CRISPR-associated endonuclease Cas1, partial [Spirochaetota bacterium]